MIRLAMLAEHADDDHSVDGGVQAVTKYLVEELAKRALLDTHVLSFSFGSRRIRTIEANGYTRHLIPAAKSDAFLGYRRDQRTVDDFLQTLKPDIVHSQGAGHYGIVAARTRYPAVITIHGIMSEEAKHAASYRLKFRRWFVSQLSDRHCIRKDKHTILISRYVADYYGKRLSGPQHFIPNPVAPGFFSVRRDEKAGRVLFVGRLLPLKGVHDLLTAVAAIARSEEVELVLAGSRDNKKYVARLESQANQLGIQGRVKYCDVLDETALLDEFARASVLVLPSYQETAPMVIQEAMAAGVPVIATRVGGIPYQLDDGYTGIVVNAGDVGMLTDSLMSVLTNHELRRTLANAAKRNAASQFRAQVIADHTIRVYQQLLS